MSYHILEPGDEEFLEECPECEKGYMVPTFGEWYQCSECGVEAKMEDGLLWFDSLDDVDETDDFENNAEPYDEVCGELDDYVINPND